MPTILYFQRRNSSNDLRLRLTSSPVRLGILRAPENLHGRVTLDPIISAQVLFGSAVDLDERDVLPLQFGGSLLILGGQSLAMTAPGGKEFGQDQVVLLHESAESVLGQRDHIRLPVFSSRRHSSSPQEAQGPWCKRPHRSQYVDTVLDRHEIEMPTGTVRRNEIR